MKPMPSSWTDKKRYVLVQANRPMSTILAEHERLLGMIGMARMRPVLIHAWRDAEWEYGVFRLTRGSEQAFRLGLLRMEGFARSIVMSGTLHGLRRKASMLGVRIPMDPHSGRRG